MILICEECSQKYRLDPARIRGTEVRFACKRCGHIIIAAKPETATTTLETSGMPAAQPRQTLRVLVKEGVENGRSGRAEPKRKRIARDPFKTRPPLRFGLTAKLFTVMILVSLVPLMLFWEITLSQVRKRIQIETTLHSTQLFSGMAQYVNEWLAEKERVITTLAGLNAVTSMDRALQEQLLQAAVGIYPQLEDIFILDKGGTVYAGTASPLSSDPASRSFFQSRLQGHGTPWMAVNPDDASKAALMLAAPIKDDSGIVGLLVHVAQIHRISKQIFSPEAGDIGFAFLMTHNQATTAQQIDIHGLHQRRLDWSALIAAFERSRTGAVAFQGPDGRAHLGYIGKTKYGWGIALQKSQTDTNVLINDLASSAHILLMFIVIFVAVMAWFSGRALSKPIIRLTDAANRISIGELDMEIRTKRKDEIGDLSEAIARLQDSIRISIERLRRRR